MAGESIVRKNQREVLIANDLVAFLSRPELALTPNDVRQVADNISLFGADNDFSTLHKLYGFMVDGYPFTPEDGIAQLVPLIDFETSENNIFRVVNQFTIEYVNNGQVKNRRPDILM